MRVLHVHSGNLFGGVESMLLTNVRQQHLAGALQSSFALCFEGQFSQELAGTNAAVHKLGNVWIRQPLTVRRARRNLRELLGRETFDVVVTHSCWSQVIFGPAARAAKAPLVFYMHGPADGKHWLERWARRTAPDQVLCNSQYTAATQPQLYPGVRSQIVYCPVAPPLEYSQASRSEIRAELQTPDDAIVIVQVSRIEALKGHLVHLEALGLLKDLPGWISWMVGGAQRPQEVHYLEELKNAAVRLGISERVRFLGQRSDVPQLLAAADVFCQPNTHPDAFGLSFIEALYARLPVVTTALGGAREIVNESCGVLTESGDVRGLAAVLRRLIEDQTLRVKLGNAGPARAQELCDPGTQLKKFSEALKGNFR